MKKTNIYPTSAASRIRPANETDGGNGDCPDQADDYQAQFAYLKDATIMLVDDEPITVDVVTAFLEEEGYWNFISTDRSTEAMDLLEATWPDVLLLDLMMPDVSGFDILTAMRADPKLKHTPVVVLTSSTGADTKLKALELGATDFLSKPVDPSELILRLRNTLAAKQYQDRLAYYDSLTGLPNRRMFMDRLDRALKNAQKSETKVAILYLGIDRFKQINDSFGLKVGDILLQHVAQRLDQSFRDSDLLERTAPAEAWSSVSRLGGDEFAVMLNGIERIENAALLARCFISVLAEPFYVEENEVFITSSIGITGFPSDAVDKDLLLKQSVVAMDYAKRQGRNTYKFYSNRIDAECRARLTLQNQLRKALDNEELLLHYQPKIDLISGRIKGAETLLRWKNPDLGLVPPHTFIPLLEELGLIGTVGDWVIREACRQNKAWQSIGLNMIEVCVNVSALQFRQRGFSLAVQSALNSSELEPRFLTLELTESMIMENAERNIAALHEVKEMGLALSVDDFGTGYSSLAYLRRFPLDELKIDRSFLTDIHANTDDATIVEAIIVMAHTLDLTVVAEGIENEQQLAFLRHKGCDQGQGYLIGKPFAADAFAAHFLQHASGVA